MARVTINVNNLSLAHRGSGGVSSASTPDVCLTPSPPGPPVPVPYPNVAQSATLSGGSGRVKVDGGNPAAVKGSEFSRSTGDEPGVAGGVGSGATGAKATWLGHSFNVFIEGRPACRLTDKMLMNAGNTFCTGLVQAPLGQAPPPRPLPEARRSGPPCDLTGLRLRQGTAGSPKEAPAMANIPTLDRPRRPRGPFVVAPPGRGGPGALTVSDELEVTTGPASRGEVTEITVEVETDVGMTCGQQHPLVTVSETRTGEQVERQSGARTVSFPVHCGDIPLEGVTGLGALMRAIWPFGRAPNVYLVEVETCGCRPSGRIVKLLSATVRAYPDDEFALKLSLPVSLPGQQRRTGSSGKAKRLGDGRIKTRERSVDRGVGGERKVESWSRVRGADGRPLEHKRETLRRSDDGSGALRAVSSEQAAGEPFHDPKVSQHNPLVAAVIGAADHDPQVVFELTRNGQKLAASDDIAAVVSAVVNLKRTIMEIWAAIQNFKPQLGFSANWSMRLMEGSVEAAWGYAEHTDHRVYARVRLAAALVIADGFVEVTFGVGIGGLGEGVLFLRLSASAEVNGNVERDEPGLGWPELRLAGRGSFIASGGFRAHLISPRALGITADISSEALRLEVAYSASGEQGTHLDCTARFMGVQVQYVFYVIGVKVRSGRATVVEPGDPVTARVF